MNVLKITTTPIRLSMTSQRARLDSEIPDPEIGIIQNPGHLNMKSENIKVILTAHVPETAWDLRRPGD